MLMTSGEGVTTPALMTAMARPSLILAEHAADLSANAALRPQAVRSGTHPAGVGELAGEVLRPDVRIAPVREWPVARDEAGKCGAYLYMSL